MCLFNEEVSNLLGRVNAQADNSNNKRNISEAARKGWLEGLLKSLCPS